MTYRTLTPNEAKFAIDRAYNMGLIFNIANIEEIIDDETKNVVFGTDDDDWSLIDGTFFD